MNGSIVVGKEAFVKSILRELLKMYFEEELILFIFAARSKW